MVMRVNFECQGVSPILMHYDNIEGSDLLEKVRKAPENKHYKRGDDRYPSWTYQVYLLSDGDRLAMPADYVFGNLRDGASKIPMGRNSNYKRRFVGGVDMSQTFYFAMAGAGGRQVMLSELPAHDLPFAEHVELLRKVGVDLHMKRVPIGQSKHVRVRAMLKEWSFRGFFDVIDKDLMDKPLITSFFTHGGKLGLGDWRPGAKSPGWYGQYKATLAFG